MDRSLEVKDDIGEGINEPEREREAADSAPKERAESELDHESVPC
jgi:hypothetical protein